MINGHFERFYEEELQLRDGYRWSDDGKQIAYWQIDTSGVPQFTIINNTDAMYPETIRFAYPKTGQTNPACRVGVVSVEGGPTRWLELPGDPRDHYLARMDWIPGTHELLLQRLNRLQNENHVVAANAETGHLRTLLVERDEAWVDVHDELMWLESNRRFTWISQRDGWRRVHLVDRDGNAAGSLTPHGYDAIELLAVDESNNRRLAYYMASPDNATRRYLYAAGLGGEDARRLTPDDQPGWHAYDISPNGKWAIHTLSRMARPPEIELIRLPGHGTVRKLVENKELEEKLAGLDAEPVEFFQVEWKGACGSRLLPQTAPVRMRARVTPAGFTSTASRPVKRSWIAGRSTTSGN